MQTMRVGTSVKVQSAGRIRHAIVTGVVSQTVLNLRVGNGATKMSLSNVSKVARHSGLDGWFQGR
jgi:hypothetical protein